KTEASAGEVGAFLYRAGVEFYSTVWRAERRKPPNVVLIGRLKPLRSPRFSSPESAVRGAFLPRLGRSARTDPRAGSRLRAAIARTVGPSRRRILPGPNFGPARVARRSAGSSRPSSRRPR